MQYLNKIKTSINNLIDNINERKELQKELEEKENNYNNRIKEISKLETEINNISNNIRNMIYNVKEFFDFITIILIISGFIYATHEILIEGALLKTLLFPIVIDISSAIITNIIGKTVIKKKLNSAEYKKIKQEIKQKKIELANNKEKTNSLEEEITNLKSQLITNTNTTTQSLEELNTMLENNSELKLSTIESQEEEKNHPKTRTLTPNKK